MISQTTSNKKRMRQVIMTVHRAYIWNFRLNILKHIYIEVKHFKLVKIIQSRKGNHI